MSFRLIKALALWLSIGSSYAQTEMNDYTHDFWLPKLHKQRLSYCLSDQIHCGKSVAERYCNLLGYQGVQFASIAHNVGRSAYLDKKTCCLGWHCAGFKLIRCKAGIPHQPIADYYYRYKKFTVPRFHHFRVDWCYQNGKNCGKPAAHAFCRHMGYEKTTQFLPEKHLAATQALGNQKLCFGNCTGFTSIICYR